MAVQLKDMTKWLAFSCTEFALVSRDVGHPLYDMARQKLYFFHYGTYSTFCTFCDMRTYILVRATIISLKLLSVQQEKIFTIFDFRYLVPDVSTSRWFDLMPSVIDALRQHTFVILFMFHDNKAPVHNPHDIRWNPSLLLSNSDGCRLIPLFEAEIIIMTPR
jgi:hypothetical protein